MESVVTVVHNGSNPFLLKKNNALSKKYLPLTRSGLATQSSLIKAVNAL
jgi:hypothetical protein